MKKLSKILCAVLMLALICTSLAFLVSADSTPDVVAINPSNVDFGAATLGSIEGNSLPADASWSLNKQKNDPNGDGIYTDGTELETTMLDRYIITPADGDAYGVFFAGANQNGGTFQNVQNTYTYKGPELTLDSYYVVDLDIATATELITSLAISLPNRNVTGDWASFGGFPFGENVEIKNYLPDLGAEWTHFTVVCSMKTNTQHIFVNGTYIGTTGKKAYNDTQLTEGTTLRANGIKLEVAYAASVNNPYMIYANESAAVDNVSRRDIVDAEGIAALDAIFAAETPNLKDWAGYPTNVRTGSLPNVVEIDGVEYNNLADAAKVLRGNTDQPKQVNLLNNFPVLTVSCDAVINKNGFDCEIRLGAGATSTTSGDGQTVTVDAPFIASQTDTLTSAFSEMQNAFRPAGNTFNWANQINNANTANGLHYYISKTADENKFVTILGSTNVTNDSNTYIDINANVNISYNGGAAQYMVFDLDAALLSNSTFPMMTIARKNGSGMWGAYNPTFNNMLATGTPLGEFQHLSIIVDIANNDIYVYANNVLTVFSDKNGFTGDDNFASFANGDAGWNFNGLRFGSNSQGGLMFDNLQHRFITGEDAIALKNALADKSITDWAANVYTSDYAMPKRGELAIVDGVKYYSASAVSARLTGNDVKNVIIARDIEEAINVNCNAVIETNGFTCNFTYGDGVTHEQVGTVINTTSPYQLSASFQGFDNKEPDSNNEIHLGSAGVNAIKDTYVGINSNALQPDFLTIAKTNDFDHFVVTANGEDETFVAIHPNHDGTAAKDIQYTLQVKGTNNLDTGTNYYVIDIDAASDTSVPASMYILATLRFADGTGGTPFCRSVFFSDVMVADGTWQHITLVGEMETGTLYVFNNGTLVATWSNSDGVHGAFNAEQGGTSTNLRFQAIKVSNNIGQADLDTDSVLYLDGAFARVYSSNYDAGNIQAALQSGNLYDWSGAVDGRRGTSLPKIATIDGVGYSSVMTANEALSGDGHSNVILDRDIYGMITINKSATVETNGLDTVKVDRKPTVIGGNLVASDMVVLGNEYIKLNESNLTDYAVPAYWYMSSDDDDPTETIYFPIGTTVGYTGTAINVKENYIVDGKLYNGGWCDGNIADDTYVTTWPTITTEDVDGGAELYYYLLDTVTETEIKATLKYNLSLYSDFDVNLFVKDADGEYTIDGEKYKIYTKGIHANNLASDLTFEVQFVVDGVTYTELVTVNVLNYATTVLNKADVSDQMKRVMMAALDYANEAYAFVAGGTNAQIEAILNNPAYAQYTVESNTEYGPANTQDPSAVLAGIQLQLDSNVALVLQVTPGFTGTVTVTYSDYKGQAWVHEYVVEEGQQYIVLDDLKVYNLDAMFNITANGAFVCQYNLGEYFKLLVTNNMNREFADALFTYAKVAKEYKTQLNNAQ